MDGGRRRWTLSHILRHYSLNNWGIGHSDTVLIPSARIVYLDKVPMTNILADTAKWNKAIDTLVAGTGITLSPSSGVGVKISNNKLKCRVVAALLPQ